MKRLYSYLHTPGSPERLKPVYWAWNWLCLLLAPILTGSLCLLICYGDYPYQLFTGILDNKFLLFMNLLPTVWLMLVLYFAVNRTWIAFLVSAVFSFVPAIVNYFKLRFRDETLVFSDVQYLKEGANISKRYALGMDWKLWMILAFVILGTVVLFLLARGRVRKKPLRWGVFAALLIAAIPLSFLYRSANLYVSKGANPEFNTAWITTEYNVSKGFWYQFLHSAWDMSGKKPEGYSKKEVEALLADYPDADIPADKRVDIITIQLEAFSDLSRLGVEGISPEVYEYYHELEAESYTGDLVASTFAAGTILTERSYLTGLYYCETVRHNTDSYVWYLNGQGYDTVFGHGNNEWFYDRSNVCDYLGFEESYFLENYYGDMNNGQITYDNIFLPSVYDTYAQAKAASDAPFFGEFVTYQGHGPYSTMYLPYGEGWYTGDVSEESYYIMNNYLGSLASTQLYLKELVDDLRDRDEPVVLVLYGDHKPWLGDSNSVYNELGINIDLSQDEGFFNYYTTRYLIWANDAARDLVGDRFSGQGPAVSPMYLMGLVFDRCGWEGPGYMQLARQWQQVLPVISSAGYTVESGVGVTYGELSEAGEKTVTDCKYVTYYKRKTFTMG